jgi:hypothetical protein
MAVTKDITVAQGATHVEVFTIEVLTDPTAPYDIVTNPYIPLDISSAAIQMQVRPTYNSSTVILTATDQNGRFTKTDPTHGVFTLTVFPGDTSLASFNTEQKSFLYDIIVKFTTNNALKVAAGNFIVEREVTRIV